MSALGDPFPGAWHESKSPDYTAVFAWRQRRIIAMRSNPAIKAGMLEYYRTHRVEFIEHWCDTYDPRLAGRDRPSKMPFVLFKRQKELVSFLGQCINLETDGLVEKCRDMGATWLCAAFSAHLWRFMPGAAVGWGSRKEQLVDKLGDADSIFEKIRMIIRSWPREFWPVGFDPFAHMPFMRIINPENGSTITGEAGDNIGRGGRKLIYFKDESAHYERPEKIEAALSDNTRVQIDISSVNGLGNVFYRRRESGVEWHPLIPMVPHKTGVFVMDWRDHPEKTQEWYDRRRQKFIDEGMLHIFAQEVERNYAASVTGIIIQPEWVRAAIDAHKTLGFDDEGMWSAALDVADEGGDKNALTIRKGPILRYAEAWGEGDTGFTARRAIERVKRFTTNVDLQYDCVGVGAGVKAESNRLVSEGLLPPGIRFMAWNAGAGPLFPDARMIVRDKDSPLNKDYFSGLKAQGWWQLARRFERTYRAVTEKREYDPGELISLPSDLPNLRTIEKELSQATQGLSAKTLKMIVEKAPEGTFSPNIADSIVMNYWPINSGVHRYSRQNIG